MTISETVQQKLPDLVAGKRTSTAVLHAIDRIPAYTLDIASLGRAFLNPVLADIAAGGAFYQKPAFAVDDFHFAIGSAGQGLRDFSTRDLAGDIETGTDFDLHRDAALDEFRSGHRFG
jgi:hypothetical protein